MWRTPARPSRGHRGGHPCPLRFRDQWRGTSPLPPPMPPGPPPPGPWAWPFARSRRDQWGERLPSTARTLGGAFARTSQDQCRGHPNLPARPGTRGGSLPPSREPSRHTPARPSGNRACRPPPVPGDQWRRLPASSRRPCGGPLPGPSRGPVADPCPPVPARDLRRALARPHPGTSGGPLPACPRTRGGGGPCPPVPGPVVDPCPPVPVPGPAACPCPPVPGPVADACPPVP
ncbi:basic proline-rich protein-like [Macrobrachium nipponense]|uniref:basic proline-rich protein-like n=1 Tax=Macrobrachium nipponense TaxID=159736 RepID=UPI0030C825B8